MFRVFRRYVIAGIIFWVPILVTYGVVHFLYGLFDKIMQVPPFKMLTVGLGHWAAIVGFVIIIATLVVTGFFIANYFGKKIIYWGELILARIPLVSSIYSTVKQSLEMIFSEKSHSFREVAMVRFPSQESWSIGFVTNKEKGILTVFVPTTPNPTSGYILFVPAEKAQILDMTVDEALKFVVSLGTASGRTSAIAVLEKFDNKEDLK